MTGRAHRLMLCAAWLCLGAAPLLARTSQQAKQSRGPNAKASLQEARDAANRRREEGRDDEAIDLYRKALALEPDWREGWWFLGTLLYERERYPEARDALRRFVADEPGTGPGWALLGMSEFKTREYPRALAHLQKSLRLGLGERKELTRSVFYFTAVLLNRYENYSDAMGMLMPMVKTTGQPAILLEPIGLNALRLPFLPEEIAPDGRELVGMAGEATLAIEAQRTDEVESLFHQMVERYPREPGVHFLYGTYLLDVRPAEGIAEMQSELVVWPSSVGARLRLAEEYIKEEKFDPALAIAEQAVQLEPNNSASRLILGEALVAKGDLAKGIVELEKARDQTPERLRTHWDLLRAYTSAGRSLDAKREKEKIEEISRPEAKP